MLSQRGFLQTGSTRSDHLLRSVSIMRGMASARSDVVPRDCEGGCLPAASEILELAIQTIPNERRHRWSGP